MPPSSLLRQASTGNDVMYVRMIEKLTRPGVKDSNHSDASADELWIESQHLKRFGGCPKQEVVNSLLVRARHYSQLFGYGEGDQEVRDGQQ